MQQTNRVFYPKLFTIFHDYNWQQFFRDITAGIVVGIISLPLAIAFGVASGVRPDQGLITAIIAGFLISALGGSRVLIGGPTGAFIVIVYAIHEEHGMAGLTIATIMAGIFLIIMGLVRLGEWVKYIPNPVIVGFTSGIALVIFSLQIPDFLGLNIAHIPNEFIGKWQAYLSNLASIKPYAALIGSTTIAIILFIRRLNPLLPGSFIALIVTALLVYFSGIPIDTIGSRFGEVKVSFETIGWQAVDFKTIKDLVSPAFVIAMLCAIESLLCAVVADGMIGGKHRPNTELIAQGMANILTPIFGGIPATGAIARTALNVRNGARTPISGMTHALTVLILVLFGANLVKYIPMASLAGILVIVAYNMSEWREFRAILNTPRADVFVLLTTFLLTVLFDLVTGIQAGITLAVFLFMKGMSDASEIKRMQAQMNDKNDPDTYYYKDEMRKVTIPPDVEVMELNGAFFFGAASKFDLSLREAFGRKKCIILRMNNILFLDATGIKIIENLVKEAKKAGSRIILTELKPHTFSNLQRAGVLAKIGRDNIFSTLQEAIDRDK